VDPLPQGIWRAPSRQQLGRQGSPGAGVRIGTRPSGGWIGTYPWGGTVGIDGAGTGGSIAGSVVSMKICVGVGPMTRGGVTVKVGAGSGAAVTVTGTTAGTATGEAVGSLVGAP